MRHARLGEALALAQLRGREHGGRRVDRVRKHEPLGDPGRDRDGPVDAGGDDSVDVLGDREAVDLGLVLDGDDRPPVGETEAGRRRIAVDRDHEEAAAVGRFEEAELSGSRP